MLELVLIVALELHTPVPKGEPKAVAALHVLFVQLSYWLYRLARKLTGVKQAV